MTLSISTIDGSSFERAYLDGSEEENDINSKLISGTWSWQETFDILEGATKIDSESKPPVPSFGRILDYNYLILSIELLRKSGDVLMDHQIKGVGSSINLIARFCLESNGTRKSMDTPL